MTNSDRILELLRRRPGLDDDEISRLSGVEPRQQVNQLCRRLEKEGVLERVRGPSGKIVNIPLDGARPTVQKAERTPAPQSVAARPAAPDVGSHEGTLIILPCSGRKSAGGKPDRPGAAIADGLPKELADRLRAARAGMAGKARLDETARLPAWRRYAGELYRAAGPQLDAAVAAGAHILIVSGGYGVLCADEAIGTYDARFGPGDWPAGLLQQVVAAYARRYGLKRMRAFVSASTAYRDLLQRIDWRAAGVEDALLVMPQGARGGAMVTAPRAQGEALAAFLAGKPPGRGWRSSDGLGLAFEQLAPTPSRGATGRPAGGRSADIRQFYRLLDRLAERVGGPRRLAECRGGMRWPARGVYFFFEPGETRSGGGPRVVRIGTHALREGARSTLRGRLWQHRGRADGGNHRGSIFRLLVGAALAGRGETPLPPSWGVGSTAAEAASRLDLDRDGVSRREAALEAKVSRYIGAMPLLWLEVDDDPGGPAQRGRIERNAIALLSACREPTGDPPSPDWLGRHSDRDRVRRSGLWNNRHVDEVHDPAFLLEMERLIERATA